MASDLKHLFEQASTLPESQRAELAGLLIEGLDPHEDEGVEEAWIQEVRTRLEDLDSGRVKSVPWEQVRARLAKRLAGA